MMKPVGIYVTLVLALMLVLMSSTAAKEADPGSVQDRLPLAAGICINKARNLFQCHQVHKAIDLLETCISKGEKDSRHYYPYFVLGNYYLTLADGKDQLNNSRTVTQRAASCYQESVNLNPLFSPGWLNLAKCQYETQAFAGAAASFEQGYNTSRTPKSVHLYSAAVCHFKAKDFKKARDVFVRLMAAHPEAMSFSYKETFVHILFSLESYRQALPYIEELAKESRIEKKKQWEQILLQQYLFLKMDQKALAYAEFLVQTDTLEPRWWKALSHIYLSNDHIRQGLSALIIYGYLTPMTGEERLLAGDLYFSLDIPATAARFYETAAKETPTPEFILKISQAFAMAHDPEKALAWIEKGLSRGQDKGLHKLKAYVLSVQEESKKAAGIFEQLETVKKTGKR